MGRLRKEGGEAAGHLSDGQRMPAKARSWARVASGGDGAVHLSAGAELEPSGSSALGSDARDLPRRRPSQRDGCCS